MDILVIALKPVGLIGKDSAAVKPVFVISPRMLPHILEGRNDFKSGAGRIKPLGGPVQKSGLRAVSINQIIPVFGSRIGIKGRL